LCAPALAAATSLVALLAFAAVLVRYRKEGDPPLPFPEKVVSGNPRFFRALQVSLPSGYSDHNEKKDLFAAAESNFVWANGDETDRGREGDDYL